MLFASYPMLSEDFILPPLTRPHLYIICSFSTSTAPTASYTLSLHDALPIYPPTDSSVVCLDPLRVAGRPQTSHADSYRDRKSTRLNSSHVAISYAVFCLKKKITDSTRKYGSLNSDYASPQGFPHHNRHNPPP